MSASFFDLLKYAATGIASPDMTHFDKMRARAMAGGYPVRTIEGVPPLTFKADGTPLISWSMLGNGSQTGTPTPDNPVMPTFCGVRTANLFDPDNTYYYQTQIVSDAEWEFHSSLTGGVYRIPCKPNTTYTLSYSGDVPITIWRIKETASDSIPTSGSSVAISGTFATSVPSQKKTTFTTSSNAKYILFQSNSGQYSTLIQTLMLNLGSAALPYEPFGYKIPITCAGQTVPVYLGEVPTVRRVRKLVLTGEESWYRNDAVSRENTSYFYTTKIADNTGDVGGYCTHFVYDSGSYSHDYEGFSVLSGYGALRIRISNSIASTVTDFKAWLASEYAAGHPVTIWYVLSTEQTGIVNEPLCKIGNYADELHSEDAGVTIPTVKGQNVLTVDTELQPSEMTITFKG